MDESVTISKDELDRLRERTRRLALEKSYLQLVNDLINKLSRVPGLDKTVEEVLRIILDNIGGTTVCLYYFIHDSLHFADVYGGRRVVKELTDSMVQRVLATRQFLEEELPYEETKMLTPEFTRASFWALPLVVGEQLIGVLKMEGMLMSAREVRVQLDPFFTYAALVLKNEIENYARLSEVNALIQRTNDELVKSQAALLAVNEQLEARVAQRTTELEATTEELRVHREHLEELVAERTKELEAANRELEAFSYSVSHDLRTPLRAIEGFSRMLEVNHVERLDDEGLRLIGVVRQNARRMARLIDDILSFSRSGRTEMHTTRVDMELLARTAWSELEHERSGRDIRFELGTLPPAEGDAPMLRQVWLNLLGNAIKFSAPASPAVIEVNATCDERSSTYFIKDNGVGFDEAYGHKLFGVFQRLHALDEFPGTGIGLAIVRRIVSRHGGTASARGKVGEGATVSFTLPQPRS